MGTAKRERQKANRAARIEAAEKAQKRQEQRRSMRNFGLLALVVIAGVALFAKFGNKGDNGNVATAGSNASLSVPPPGSTPGGSAPGAPGTTIAPGPPIMGDTPCPSADGSSTRTIMFAKPPPTCIDPAKTYTAKVTTTKGDFTIKLDAAKAPRTVNNFVVLSRYHYFDGVPFHRVMPGFVVQGGDPSGTGSGPGPGYTIEDELPAAAGAYTPGVVAMANTGKPNSGGSQFYVVLAAGQLPSPSYSILGTLTDGLDTTLAAIATGDSVGDPINGSPPKLPAVINSVTITET